MQFLRKCSFDKVMGPVDDEKERYHQMAENDAPDGKQYFVSEGHITECMTSGLLKDSFPIVIASEAKQSIHRIRHQMMDCFVAKSAPRNDLACFSSTCSNLQKV